MKSQLISYFNATPLFQNNKYSIEKYINENTKDESLCVIKDKTISLWVTVYEPGKVGYDNPYLLPEYIKSKVREFSKNLKINA
jgi:hypothetical protein